MSLNHLYYYSFTWSILCLIFNIISPALCILFVWYIFYHHFISNLSAYLYLNTSLMESMYLVLIFSQSDSLCLLIRMFRYTVILIWLHLRLPSYFCFSILSPILCFFPLLPYFWLIEYFLLFYFIFLFISLFCYFRCCCRD